MQEQPKEPIKRTRFNAFAKDNISFKEKNKDFTIEKPTTLKKLEIK